MQREEGRRQARCICTSCSTLRQLREVKTKNRQSGAGGGGGGKVYTHREGEIGTRAACQCCQLLSRFPGRLNQKNIGPLLVDYYKGFKDIRPVSEYISV
jgi:hypothetical protein